MARQKKVIDASVFIKLFTHEKDSEKALVLLEEYKEGKSEIVVPELFFLEVLNGLKYKKQNEEMLLNALRELWNLEVTKEVLSRELLIKTLSLAIEKNLTVYDALYAAVAQAHDAMLITADSSLAALPNAVALEKT